MNSLGMFSLLGRALRDWRPHWRLAVPLVVALFVQQLFHTFFAYSLKLIIDNVLAGSNDPPLTLILGGLLVGFAVMAVASIGGEYLSARAGAAIINDIRRRLFLKLQELSAGFYVRMNLGDILARFTSDLEALKEGYLQAFLNTILIGIGLLINVPVMFNLEWRLALLTVALLPLILLVVGRLTPSAVQATYRLQQVEGGITNAVQESIRAQAAIKVFGLKERWLRRFSNALEHLAMVAVRSRFAIALVGKVSSLSVLLIQLAITAVGAYLAFRGDLSAGSLVAFLSILGVVSKDVYEFAKKVVPSLIRASGGVWRIDEILQEPVLIADKPTARSLPRLRRQIRFEDVSFSYSGESLNLDGVNLAIEAGYSVAFVGPSGSGKSTVLNLLMRFYDVRQGAVTFDGIDIREATVASLREQMGAVFQENFMFNDTIGENIRLSRPGASQGEVEAAARAAEIHDFIAAMPEGYDTKMGEAGGRLSGGQRQRVAIARAILREPAILLLDEATSALDPGTEAAINHTIARLARDRTVISVTHRLASVVGLDQIFVMQNGRLVEQGTHQALLDRQGLYHELWQKQSGFEISQDGRVAQVEAKRLRRVRLFENIAEERLQHFADEFRSEYCEKDRDVIVQGDLGDKMYLIVRGEVDVLVEDEEGVRHKVERLADGDHFGEMALLTDLPRNATIRTVAPSLFLTLSRVQLLQLLDQFPECRAAIDERMAQSRANLATIQKLQVASR